MFSVLESLDNTNICIEDTLPQRVDIIDQLVVHRIRCDSARLSQYAHRSVQEWLELSPNSQRDITKASENMNFNVPIEDLTSQVLRQDAHEGVGVIGCLWTQSTRDVSDEADGDAGELAIFVGLKGRIEVGQEGGNIGSEVLIQV